MREISWEMSQRGRREANFGGQGESLEERVRDLCAETCMMRRD